MFDRAVVCWQKYLAIRPGDIFVLTRMADGYKMMGRFQEAEDSSKQVLAINGRDHHALMGLADLYHKCGHESLAIEHYEKLLDSGARLIHVMTIVGNLCRRRGEFEKAESFYTKALEAESDNPYALYGLGEVWRWRCDYRRVIELWERLLKKTEGTDSMLSRLGDAHRVVGDFEAAERNFRKVLDKGFNRYAAAGLAKLRCLQGKMAEAAELYDELLLHEKNDERFIGEIGAMLVEVGRRDDARRLYRMSIERQQAFPETCNVILGWLTALETTANTSSDR
jgi:tetratricopeptide (TPR) repeat protein